MARLPRKPRLLKYPKKPKASSSAAVLSRYLDRVKNIDKANRDRLHDYEKAVKQFEAEKKRHADLVKRISGIGSAVDGVKRRHTSSKRKTTKKHAAKKRVARKKSSTRKRATRRRR